MVHTNKFHMFYFKKMQFHIPKSADRQSLSALDFFFFIL